MEECLHKMSDQARTLDKRFSRHAQQSERWHATWDDPPKLN
jgi:hypothetical protein